MEKHPACRSWADKRRGRIADSKESLRPAPSETKATVSQTAKS